MKTKWIISCAAALALLGSGAWFFSDQTENGSVSSSVIPLVNIQWREGSSQQYQLQMNSNMSLNTGVNNAPQAMTLKMESLLDVYAIEVSGTAATVGMQLSSVDLRISGQSDDETNRNLELPFRVRFEVGGMPVTFEFPPQVSIEHRGILENTVRTFQASTRGDQSWSTQEKNASGNYDAYYQRSTPFKIEKTKSHFSSAGNNPLLESAVISSKEILSLNQEVDWVESMIVEETLQTDPQGSASIEVVNKASIELISVGQPISDSYNWQFIAAAPSVSVSLKGPQQASLTPAEARRQLLNSLPSLDAAKSGRSQWIHRLRDFLLVDDALPGLLLEQLKTQEFSDRTQADLYLALELTGSQAAQVALSSAITDRSWPIKDNLRAIVALSGIQNPTPETLEVLWETAEADDRSRLAGTATYALGTLASTMRRVGEEDYSQVSQRLLSGAQSGLSVESRARYIHALGNTKDPELSYDVSALLDEQDPALRCAAAQSLALLNVDRHANKLMTSFSRESNSRVRGAIAETLVKWTEPTDNAIAMIRSTVGSESDENTRLQMVRFLGKNLEKFPESKPMLQALLRTEQSKRVRQTAADALAISSGITASSATL